MKITNRCYNEIPWLFSIIHNEIIGVSQKCWFPLIWKRDFEIRCFSLISLRLVTLILPILAIANDTCDWYLYPIHDESMNPYSNFFFAIEFLIIVSKSSAGGARKHLRFENFIRKYLYQDYEFDQNFSFANLAKVFLFTFAKWISPSPLAKCEGLCASLG